MSCKEKKENCGCQFNIKDHGVCDVARIKLDGKSRKMLNWSEVSVPEIMTVPDQKPDIEHLNQIYVTAKNIQTKLIETPFAYDIYDRQATPFEITAVTDAIGLAEFDLTPVTNAVNAILAIPGLPAIPAVAALQAALDAVTTAGTSLATAVTDALTTLAGPCLLASTLVTLVQSVEAAVNLLRDALNALILAANALVTATAAIPIVGPLVEAAVDVLVTAINVVLDAITTALDALLAAITLVGDTSVLVIKGNEEGTCLSGRKLIVEGVLEQKAIYTALVSSQSVHTVENQIPFNAYIIPYANFDGLTYEEGLVVVEDPAAPCVTKTVNGFLFNPANPLKVDLCESFDVSVCVEDIFAYPVDERNIFKNTTLFLWAKPEDAMKCQ